jgi:hypothetical protein
MQSLLANLVALASALFFVPSWLTQKIQTLHRALKHY